MLHACGWAALSGLGLHLVFFRGGAQAARAGRAMTGHCS